MPELPSVLQRVTKSGIGPPRLRALLGACGKHRSYREHFDDLDKQPELVAIKEMLYDRGIREAVDKGIWKDVQGTADFVPFGHTLVGRRAAGEWAFARIVASPDLVGRDDYPLILVALLRSGRLTAAAVVERLRSLEASVAAADTLAAAQAAVAKARRALVEAVDRPRARPDDAAIHDAAPDDAASPRPALATLAESAPFDAEQRGLTNALYQLDKRFGLVGSDGAGGRKAVDRAVHLRVPAGPQSASAGEGSAGDVLPAAVAWIEMIAQEVSPGLVVLAFVADRAPGHIDLIVGTPAAADFHFLHANGSKLPVIDQIPYQIDAATASRIDARIDAARRGVRANELSAGALGGTVGSPDASRADSAGAASLLVQLRPHKALIAIAAVAVLVVVIAIAAFRWL